MIEINEDIETFSLQASNLFEEARKTISEDVFIGVNKVRKYVNEFWTSRQRQANSIHEVSYRACFKPQLPRFFIERLTDEDDTVYDPFAGRGTTIIEAALLNRNTIANDINPLSKILSEPRLLIPDLARLRKRLDAIVVDYNQKTGLELGVFYHPKTLCEILSIRKYLIEREAATEKDDLDKWIQMVATNRLTGHSKGFFSVYTLPPNQAVSVERQKKINESRNQEPQYKDTKDIILKKTISLLRDISSNDADKLRAVHAKSLFLNRDATNTPEIPDSSVQLTVTSPPFLDIVQYASDNWLRCWFNNIDAEDVAEQITMSRRIEQWRAVMSDVFSELFRITKDGGYVAFEVGEVRNGSISLDEHIVELGISQGFMCSCIMINEQNFTKTANIWGISNNSKGTNSNRIVIFKK